MHIITDEQAKTIMATQSIPSEIITSATEVAVIFTQGWCSQWRQMLSFLSDERYGNVYQYTYDRSPFFKDFMKFKETTFNNHEVPFILYYKDGVLTNQSNYVSQEHFDELLFSQPNPS
jgi:hypothetical protein